MKEKRLGKGLESLISGSERLDMEQEVGLKDSRKKSERLIDLKLSEIVQNKKQPRKHFNDITLEQLAKSIQSEGVVQPVVVRVKDEKYELVSGERRWRAAQRIRLETIPAVVIDADDKRSMQIALIENIQREDLSPIEKAHAFNEYISVENVTQNQLADVIGIDRSTVANFIRLLELPEDIQEAVSRGTLTMGHARAILAISGERERRALAKRIELEGLSVRKIESIIKLSGKSERRRKVSLDGDPLIKDIEDKLSAFFGTRVKLEAGNKRGRILIDYYDNMQLNDILSKLGITV
jgi:ParB family transcriptional regulator, chromosome partitioning protein